MKIKSTAALLGGFVLLIVAVFVIVKFFDPTTKPITEGKGYANSANLSKQQAILYISKNVEKLEKDSAEGQLVFINKENKIKAYTISPVEFGGTVFQNHKLMVEQAKTLLLAKDEVVKTKFKTPEYRGLRASYIKNTNQFYAIYNSGLSEEVDYKMTIRYSTADDKFSSLLVPNFVSAAGETGDEVLLLTQDLISNEFQLKSVKLAADEKVKLISKLPIKNPANLDAISQILVDEENYYFVMTDYQMEDREDVWLYTINRKTHKMSTTILAKYRTVKETESSIPLTFNDSLHKWKDKLYYINGAGKVYSYDMKSREVDQPFTFNEFPVKDMTAAQLQYKGHEVYTIYKDKSDKMYLDSYDLLTGKRNIHHQIKGLEKYLEDGNIMTHLNIIG
ncbi:MAG: hypothetical protein KBT36_01775 [Kurthia sp.]|nr:hypothetical protein [Candidatus Kurthia equi]